MAKLESEFQKDLIDEIEGQFPGCVILKNDPNYLQGFPDLTIFYKDRYAILEVKKSKNASHQPNQDWYIEELAKHTFAAFVYPENKEEILNGLQSALSPGR